MKNEAIQTLLEEFLKHLGIQHEKIEIVDDTGQHPIFFIRTSESNLLIGRNGDNLRSLTMLLKQMVRQKDPASTTNFLVDVNGYHTKHIRDLKKNAELLAERVRMFRSPVEMSPMNAYDRMIVHSAFANDPDIATESEGEGKFRRIVLKHKQK